MPRLCAVVVLIAALLGSAALASAQAPTLREARSAFASGRYADAEREAARVFLEDPALRSAAATLRGEAFAAVGKLDEAEVAFAEAEKAPLAFRARALYARLLLERGRTAEAAPLLQALINAYNEDELGPDRAGSLAYVAMAARMLGSAHDANDTFREAAVADRTRVETQLEWAELFLDKRDIRHARASADEALQANPQSPRAHVLMASNTCRPRSR